MKCHALFSRKLRKISSICRFAKFIHSMVSVKFFVYSYPPSSISVLVTNQINMVTCGISLQ